MSVKFTKIVSNFTSVINVSFVIYYAHMIDYPCNTFTNKTMNIRPYQKLQPSGRREGHFNNISMDGQIAVKSRT